MALAQAADQAPGLRAHFCELADGIVQLPSASWMFSIPRRAKPTPGCCTASWSGWLSWILRPDDQTVSVALPLS